jgi:hypothetical protein
MKSFLFRYRLWVPLAVVASSACTGIDSDVGREASTFAPFFSGSTGNSTFAPLFRGSTGKQMFIVAHEDDDLLFQSPDLFQAVSTGRPTVTIFLTAGNVDYPGNDKPALDALCGAEAACRAQRYIEFRIAGSIMAYYGMNPPGAVAPPTYDWSSNPASKLTYARDVFARAGCAKRTYGSSAKKAYRCTPSPRVELIYLGLSASNGVNGNYPEAVPGSSAADYWTIEDLWKGNVGSLRVADGRLGVQTYTRGELIEVLASQMALHAPTRIGTLDSTKTVYDIFSIREPPVTGWHLDHSDHIYSALFALQAEQRFLASKGRAHELRIYRTYNLESLPYSSAPRFNLPTLPCPLAQAKTDAFNAYNPWDWGPGIMHVDVGPNCSALYAATDSYPQWLSRQAYTTSLASFGASRIQGLGGCLGQSSNGTASIQPCSAASRWRLDGRGQLHVQGTTTCLDSGSATLLAACASPPSASQTWTVLSNGQIRGSGGTCLTVSGTSVSATGCAELSSQHSDDGIYPQRWTVDAGAASSSGTFPDSGGWSSSETRYKSVHLADVDGDGWADVCGRDGTGILCALNDHSGGFLAAKPWGKDLFGDSTGWGAPQYGTTVQFGDINGDGRADVCGRGPAGIVCAISNGASFTGMALRSTSFSDGQGWNAQSSYYGSIRLADVDGDGRSDVCGRDGTGILCALSDHGGGFLAATHWGNHLFGDDTGWGAPQYGTTIRFGDINGDGRADVCGRGSAGVFCALSNGASFFSMSLWTRDFSDAEGWGTSEVYHGSIRLADVNGDGLADICGRSVAGIFCGLSQGMGFHRDWNEPTALEYADSAGWGSAPYATTIQLGDINGDGRADLCGRSAEGVLCSTMPTVGH